MPDLGRLRAERVRLPEPDAALLARLRALPHLALLDSAAGGNYTVVAAGRWARLLWSPGRGEIRIPGGARVTDEDFRQLLRTALETTSHDRPSPLPFGPGWIGSLGYGLRRAFERVPDRHPNETGLAEVDLSYSPAVAVHDRQDQSWWMLWREEAERPK